MSFSGLDFGFGGSSLGGMGFGAGAGSDGSGNTQSGAPVGESVLDYEELLRDMPPKEVLPDPIATKVAITPPPLTTQPPPFTHKPPESELPFSFFIFSLFC